MADNGLVVQLKSGIKQDACLDRADLIRIGLDAERLQWNQGAVEALNQVLDELFVGTFQSPTCYRIADDAVSDLKIFNHYLTQKVRDYLPAYLQKQECSELVVKPETVQALLQVAHDEIIPNFNKVRETYLSWLETILREVGEGLAMPAKEVREVQWHKYTDAYATVLGLQQQATAIRQRAQDAYKGLDAEPSRLLDALIAEIHDLQILDESQKDPQALEQQCLRLQLKPVFAEAVEVGSFVRGKRFPHEILGGLIPKDMPLCSNDPRVKSVIYFVKGRSVNELKALLASPMGIKNLLPIRFEMSEKSPIYRFNGIQFFRQGVAYKTLEPLAKRHSFCLSFSIFPVDQDWTAVVYQPHYVDAKVGSGAGSIEELSANEGSKILWNQLQQFKMIGTFLDSTVGKIVEAERMEREILKFDEAKRAAYDAYWENRKHNGLVYGLSIPVMGLGVVGTLLGGVLGQENRNLGLGIGLGGLAVLGGGLGLMFGWQKDEETTGAKYRHFEEVEKWHEWLKEHKPPTSTQAPGTTIFSWAGQF